MTARRAIAALLLGASSACRDAAEARERVQRAPRAEGVAMGMSREGARHVRTFFGFQDPESVLYDAEQDVYFVSNMAGFGSLEDDNGFILRIGATALGNADTLASGGAEGVTLDAPKGMTIQGDTLWVTDIDELRGFDRRTGAPVATIDFAPLGVRMLNDVAAGADGTLRVTDTGIYMVYEGNIHTGPDRIFSVGPRRAVSVVAEGPQLRQPNGIAWDRAGKRWLVVGFAPFDGDVATMAPRVDSARRVLQRGPGRLDGVEPLPGDGVLFSSWADSSIHVLRGGRDVRVVREVPEAADIGLDTRRGRVLIPLATLGQVQVWDLGPWWRGR